MNTDKQKSKIPMPPAKLWEILNEPIGGPIAEEELKNYRMIGVVDGIVDVERLKTDTSNFYYGYRDGVRAAYEVLVEKPKFNCPYSTTCNCDKSIPCACCEGSPASVEISDDYKRGYDIGYEKGEELFYDNPEFNAGWSKYVKDEEYFEKGHDMSYNRGYTDGVVRGYDKAKVEFAEGITYAEGHSAGYDEGYDVGYEVGIDVGYEEAINEVDEDHLLLDRDLLEHLGYILYLTKSAISKTVKMADDNILTATYRKNLYSIHHEITALTEKLVMEQVYAFWANNK